MSASLATALDNLVAALDTVEGLKGLRGDQVGKVVLPCAMVGMPTPTWGTYGPGPLPDGATFPVTLLVRLDDQAIESLLRYLEATVLALETTPAVVTAAVPLSFDLGQGVTAAAVELTVEYPL